MKALFISNLFPNSAEPSRGIFNFRQVFHLTKLCQVRVVAPIAWFPIKGRFAPPAPVPSTEEIGGLTVEHPRQYYLPKIGRTFNPLLYALSLRKLVIDLRVSFPFDVIFVNWAYPDACGIAKIARQLRVPFIVSISGSDANVGLTFRTRRRQILRMLAQASAITVRSRALRNLLISHGADPGKIHVLYNGVDRVQSTSNSRNEARQRLGFDIDERVLIYVGRLSAEKGVADLIEAIAILRDHHRMRVRLLIVGDGWQGSELRELAETRGLSPAIVWAGQKRPEEVSGCLNAADVLCLASHMEGVPNAALEAFACGLPVVGTQVGGIPEVVTDEVGVLARPQDPADLAQALHDALSRRWNANTIRTHAAKFDWDANAKRLLELLTAATTTHPA